MPPEEDQMPEDFSSVFPTDNTDEYGDPLPQEPTPTPEPEPEPTPEPQPEPEPQPTPTPEPEPEPEPQKPVQTSEQNAKFAEQRRQQQVEERAKQLAEERWKQSPEYLLAQEMAGTYGLTAEQALQQVREQKLKQEAEQKNIPIEFLRQRQEQDARYAGLQKEMQQLKSNAWAQRIGLEREQVKQQFAFLTDDDMQGAINYMLYELKNPDVPFQQVVYAVHGQKIMDGLRESARQEALAELGGRKPSPIPPQGSTIKEDKVILTDEEKYVAKALGVSNDDYAKNKE